MSKVYEFLKLNNMTADSIDRENAVKLFGKDICGSRPDSYISSFQKAYDGEALTEDCLAIDAGGTNIRFTYFKKGIFSEPVSMKMIGTEAKVSADDFFNFLAGEIDKYPCKNVGFIFSYQCEILSNKDGRVLRLSKELNVKGIEGKILGEEINKRLKHKREFSVLNDTVAAQLSVGADAAIILGTGFNISYTDKASGFIICSECGHYEHLPYGTFDLKLSDKCENKKHDAEKMLSGAYLPKLIKLCTEGYFDRDLGDFSLSDVSELMNCGSGKLAEALNESEQSEFIEIVKLLELRGAKIISVMLEVLLKDYKRAKVALEGTTVYKLPGYLDALTEEIKNTEDINIELIDSRGLLPLGAVRSTLSRA